MARYSIRLNVIQLGPAVQCWICVNPLCYNLNRCFASIDTDTFLEKIINKSLGSLL